MAVDILLNWLHIVCAALFVGTMCFATFLLMPVVKAHLSHEERQKLFGKLIPRIRGVIRPVVVLLVLTGAVRAALLHFTAVGPPAPGRLLAFGAKLAFAGLAIAIFALAPRVLGKGSKQGLCCDPDAEGYILKCHASRLGEALHYIAIAAAGTAALLGVLLDHMH